MPTEPFLQLDNGVSINWSRVALVLGACAALATVWTAIGQPMVATQTDVHQVEERVHQIDAQVDSVDERAEKNVERYRQIESDLNTIRCIVEADAANEDVRHCIGAGD